MLHSDEIVPFYATLGRIIDKPHTLAAEVEALRKRFPHGGVQDHLDTLMDRLGHFVFREEDPEKVVELHRRAIELVGETLALGPGMNETEVAVAIKTVMAEGGEQYQEMDTPDYPVVPLGEGVFARKPAPKESTSTGLMFYLEFLRLQEKRNAPEEMPSGEISLDIETTPGERHISPPEGGDSPFVKMALPIKRSKYTPEQIREAADRCRAQDPFWGAPPTGHLPWGLPTPEEKRRIIRNYLRRSDPRFLSQEPPTDSRDYPPAILRDPEFQKALAEHRKAEQSEEGKDETDE